MIRPVLAPLALASLLALVAPATGQTPPGPARPQLPAKSAQPNIRAVAPRPRAYVRHLRARRRPPSPAEKGVVTATWAATREPVAAGFVDAVQVYPFTEGSLYQVYAAPERVTDIALQPGEALIAVAAGDTARWIIGDTTSGSGADKRTHVLVKPFAAGLATNVVITTDRRSYHLALASTSTTAMVALSWSYPQGYADRAQARGGGKGSGSAGRNRHRARSAAFQLCDFRRSTGVEAASGVRRWAADLCRVPGQPGRR